MDLDDFNPATIYNNNEEILDPGSIKDKIVKPFSDPTGVLNDVHRTEAELLVETGNEDILNIAQPVLTGVVAGINPIAGAIVGVLTKYHQIETERHIKDIVTTDLVDEKIGQITDMAEDASNTVADFTRSALNRLAGRYDSVDLLMNQSELELRKRFLGVSPDAAALTNLYTQTEADTLSGYQSQLDNITEDINYEKEKFEIEQARIRDSVDASIDSITS